jgi:hypothetical protein
MGNYSSKHFLRPSRKNSVYPSLNDPIHLKKELKEVQEELAKTKKELDDLKLGYDSLINSLHD